MQPFAIAAYALQLMQSRQSCEPLCGAQINLAGFDPTAPPPLSLREPLRYKVAFKSAGAFCNQHRTPDLLEANPQIRALCEFTHYLFTSAEPFWELTSSVAEDTENGLSCCLHACLNQ